MIPKIYVINLKTSVDRKEHMDQQFKLLVKKHPELKLNIEYFPAVHGTKEPNHPLFKKYNAEKHFTRKGRHLSLSELGCFASHYLVWQQCLNDGIPIIVLEDDANLLDNFVYFLQEANDLAEKYQFLWLHKNHRSSKYITIAKTQHFTVAKYFREFICTTGYLITPETAQKFINYFNEIIYPVDDQMSRFYENKVENFSVYPPCIIDAELESIITQEGRSKSALNILSKLKREYYSTKDNICRFIYNLKYRI
ncbi:glycosyltransferase family 25 protein [Testudinibacter sp. TR-2022]|uniref:glycosyltransferase family 25 protein n=3 Tax=Testudinibacter sp. TR-2022 TaxID=2585029 RepID=UPI001119744F|nr:glycosyltransferase family 25 protein [Testudinibacter sp. TR-2022]TNH11662.1 glycosyltransferase family 25 protein [Testudinibacter sp. TR-2022]TNH13133.1 glycosyltransferase family 25 protein [Testudinibacter sp. TR-2022]